jgi:beta-N-acetylhexosaminidase
VGSRVAGVVSLLVVVILGFTMATLPFMAHASTAPSPRPLPTVTATPQPPQARKGAANEIIGTQNSAVEDTVAYYLSQMSLDEKLGQMFMVETYAQCYCDDLPQMVGSLHAGALIIYKKNMTTPDALRGMTAGAQEGASIPLFITMDEEGGNVDRLGDLHFADPLPSASWLGSTGNADNAYNAGTRAATELASFGINVDLAPVVDVRTIPDPVIGPRIYGATASTVDAYAGAFLDGLQQHHVIGTLKHWPGIGSIALDPHLTLPEVTRTRAELDATDFATFQAMLARNPGMIMVTHVLLDAVDPSMPSSLSPKVVQGVLRDQLGYQGVVITDNLYMKGVSLRYSLGEAAVLSVLAGDDLLEGPWDASSLRSVEGSLRAAVQSGRIPMGRIDESVGRILRLKAQYGIVKLHAAPAPAAAGLPPAPGVASLPRRDW